jgi:hypothetical protein
MAALHDLVTLSTLIALSVFRRVWKITLLFVVHLFSLDVLGLLHGE